MKQIFTEKTDHLQTLSLGTSGFPVFEIMVSVNSQYCSSSQNALMPMTLKGYGLLCELRHDLDKFDECNAKLNVALTSGDVVYGIRNMLILRDGYREVDLNTCKTSEWLTSLFSQSGKIGNVPFCMFTAGGYLYLPGVRMVLASQTSCGIYKHANLFAVEWETLHTQTDIREDMLKVRDYVMASILTSESENQKQSETYYKIPLSTLSPDFISHLNEMQRTIDSLMAVNTNLCQAVLKLLKVSLADTGCSIVEQLKSLIVYSGDKSTTIQTRNNTYKLTSNIGLTFESNDPAAIVECVNFCLKTNSPT